MEKKTAVGIFIMTDVSGSGLAAILQKRGKWNYEKTRPESYPGGCQPTIWGGVNEDESIPMTLSRETAEELGRLAWAELFSEKGELIKSVYREETATRLNIHHAVMVPYEFLKLIRLHRSADGLIHLRKDQITEIQDLTKFDRHEGVADRRIVAMFPDAIEAVKKAFELFSRT